MPASARLKISAAVKARPRSEQPVWSDDDRRRLREAFDTGGRPAAYAAFPQRSRGAIAAAIRRYCSNEHLPHDFVTPKTRTVRVWDNPEFNQRFEALALEALCRDEISFTAQKAPSRRKAVGMPR